MKAMKKFLKFKSRRKNTKRRRLRKSQCNNKSRKEVGSCMRKIVMSMKHQKLNQNRVILSNLPHKTHKDKMLNRLQNSNRFLKTNSKFSKQFNKIELLSNFKIQMGRSTTTTTRNRTTTKNSMAIKTNIMIKTTTKASMITMETNTMIRISNITMASTMTKINNIINNIKNSHKCHKLIMKGFLLNRTNKRTIISITDRIWV